MQNTRGRVRPKPREDAIACAISTLAFCVTRLESSGRFTTTGQKMQKRLLWLALTAAALPASAGDSALVERVQAFLYERASTQGDEVVIDVRAPSARLPACINPEPFLTNPDTSLRNRVSVGVRCGDDGRQVRYMQASVDIAGTYLTLANPVDRGETITRDDLVETHGSLGKLPRGAILDAEDAIGQAAARRLSEGRPLLEHYIHAPRVVLRGEPVVVEVVASGFRVEREAEAIDEGGLGDAVRVRLPDRQTLKGRVIAPGRVAMEG